MYYPKSQIKTALFTNGEEFSRSDDQSNYTGYYWENSLGQYFTGKTPQDKPTVALIKQEIGGDDEQPILPQNFSAWTKSYPNSITNNVPGVAPSKYFPKLSESDYSLGSFQRYFTKKTNQNIYYEINKEDHQAIDTKDPRIKWDLYLAIQIPWNLTGDKESTYATNRNVVKIKENQSKLPGFSKIFREDYLQYYKE